MKIYTTNKEEINNLMNIWIFLRKKCDMEQVKLKIKKPIKILMEK